MLKLLVQKHLTSTDAETILHATREIYITKTFLLVNNSASAVKIWLYYSEQGNYDANSLMFHTSIAANSTEKIDLEVPFRGGTIGIMAAKAETANVITITGFGQVIR